LQSAIAIDKRTSNRDGRTPNLVTWPVEINEMGPSNIICTNVLVGTLRKLFGG